MNQKQFTLHHGDCIDALRLMPDCSVDAIVTDPPYGLSFMGKKWDYDVPSVEVWAECLRVLKPGGHLLAFAGTRTQHRMAVRIEDAGFEIRDMIAWVYGSGFPKSLDVSKAIDKAAGAEREVVGRAKGAGSKDPDSFGNGHNSEFNITAPATDAAKQWQGWGTALKPALEPITVARKPLVGTVAENVLQYGTGAINVDGGRVNAGEKIAGGGSGRIGNFAGKAQSNGDLSNHRQESHEKGRWPANFIHDGSDEVVGLFPDTGKSTGGRTVKRSGGGNVGSGKASESEWSNDDPGYGDSGSAARFFYCAKASKRDRDAGLDGSHSKQMDESRKQGNPGGDNPRNRGVQERTNFHPTVKPTDLMRYLCRLVTPPNGIVLDPFNGSGSTGCAAVLEGFQYIGIEREAEYIAISEKRIQNALQRKNQVPPKLF